MPPPVKKVNPSLEKIAWCESGGKQFHADGSVVKGRIDSDDTGKFQINLRYHGKAAERMGIDLFTLEGNTAYALYLFNSQGTQPWMASAPCWNK